MTRRDAKRAADYASLEGGLLEKIGSRFYKSVQRFGLSTQLTESRGGHDMGASTNGDLQVQIDALLHQITLNRSAIDALEVRADVSEAQALVDRDMIAELQRDGVLSQAHAAEMEMALKSSRTIGAAIGLIMGSRNLSENEAFEVLRTASQHSNRKLRELAADLVASGSSVGSLQDQAVH